MLDWLKANPWLWSHLWLWWGVAFLAIELSAVWLGNGRTMTAYCRAIFGLGPPIDGVDLAFRPWLLVAILMVIAAHMFYLLARWFK